MGRLRVAAYCRVSTDSSDQLHSLESQRTYFASSIAAHPEWELAAVYADEGISGTSTKRRVQFNRMIADAGQGNFDLILTKEVSRFARNTVDTLEYTRKLKQWGVGVIFLADNIDTRDGDGEFRLAIMASVAQEESRKTSERVRWGQRRSMERGVVFGNDSTYGFSTRNGTLTIREDEAEIVRRIYHAYLEENKGTCVIAREMNEKGIPSPKGVQWSPAMVLRLLRNEKYAGDLRQGKYVTLDHLTHQKVLNPQGEVLCLRDHHPAVVSRSQWEQVQRKLNCRRPKDSSIPVPHAKDWCAAKIFCGECGSRMILRQSRRKSGCYRAWECHRRAACSTECDCPMLNEQVLKSCLDYVITLFPIEGWAIFDELLEQLEALDIPERDIREEILRKKERLLDAYLDGKIAEQDMLRLQARYDRNLTAVPERIVDRDFRDSLQRAFQQKETVYRALIDRITVSAQRVSLRLECLNQEALLTFAVHGAGEGYTVTITNLEWRSLST